MNSTLTKPISLKHCPSTLFLWAIFQLITSSCQPSKPQQEDTNTKVMNYQQKHRPLFHFSPPSMWMNDPNGMVFYEGEYHLFYQHYPDDKIWGPMHWGHAISENLVDWKNEPIALYPDSLGYIFSGSAVLDQQNSSGLGTQENPPLVAIYTYHHPEQEKAGSDTFQVQGIAFSLDKGRNWTKYEGNPVMKNPGIKDFRDPKVFWYAPTNQWIMALAEKDRIGFYQSKNLLQWEKLSEFGHDQGGHGGVWECPDLFPLPLNGDENQQQWVLLVSINPGGPNRGSATQYFLGDFDGTTFTSHYPDAAPMWLDYGTDNYAGVSWSGIPQSDGRRLFIGWMSNWLYANQVPTDPWRSAMTIPRSLHLMATPTGNKIASKPITELAWLREDPVTISEDTLTFGNGTFEMTISWPANAGDALISLTNDTGDELKLGFKAEEQLFFVDRTKAGNTSFAKNFPTLMVAPRFSQNDTISMQILVDIASVEVFADQGLTTMTAIFFPNKPLNKLSIALPHPFEAQAWPLKSIAIE